MRLIRNFLGLSSRPSPTDTPTSDSSADAAAGPFGLGGVDAMATDALPPPGARYARLLTAKTGLVPPWTEKPVARAHRNLEALAKQSGDQGRVYQDAADDLRFAKIQERKWAARSPLNGLKMTGVGMVLTMPYEKLQGLAAARVIIGALQERGRVVVPCARAMHFTLLEIVREGQHADPNQNAYTLRMHNAARPTLRHPGQIFSDKRKVRSVYEVRGARLGEGKTNINARELVKLWGPEPTVMVDFVRKRLDSDAVYRWMDRKGQADHTGQMPAVQGAQKAGNCSHKSINAYLRNTLPDVAYCEAMAHLYETTAQTYIGPEDLKEKLVMQAKHRLEKAQRARLRDAFLSEAAGQPWFYTDSGQAEYALATQPRPPFVVYYQAACRTAYVCSRQDDESARMAPIEFDVMHGRPILSASFPGAGLQLFTTVDQLLEEFWVRY